MTRPSKAEPESARMDFQFGHFYSRREISKILGGSSQNYLPHVDNHVVCGCFRKDLNPGAPKEILPANSDDKRRWAERLCQQSEAIPIFLKEQTNRWKYCGYWRCKTIVTDSQIIAQKGREARRTDIAMVLELEKVGD